MSKKLAEILDLAKSKIGQPYVFGSRVPMANPDWNGPWDCAEFVSWCVYQVTKRLYGTEPRGNPVLADAYTGYWWEQSRGDGSRIPLEQALAMQGAILLRRPQGNRNGHIAFSDGRGGTVEAHSRARGVCEWTAQGRGWDTGLILPWLDVRALLDVVPYEAPELRLRVTVPLTRSEEVRRVQQQLNELGFSAGREDGVYGPQTAHAVSEFQLKHRMNPDGEVGILTWKKLMP